MHLIRRSICIATVALVSVLPLAAAHAELGQNANLPGGGVVSMFPSQLNAVRFPGDTKVCIYKGGSPGDVLLLTDGRRDLVAPTLLEHEHGEALPTIYAPAKATYWLSQPESFWKTFVSTRFHDYAQQTTKVPAAALPVDHWAKDGDVIEVGDYKFRALETPGYTRSGMSYLVDVDGKRIAFTGDLIYGHGQLLDLYSVQDAIPSAQIRGYHGYGSRLAELVASLKKLREASPDLIVPARGAIIRKPIESIDRLIERVQALYANYLSTNALHWYFKEQRMKECGRRVLGPDASVELMPYCQHEQTPAWIFENSTSRLLISESKNGFLLDCGNARVIAEIQKLQKSGVINKVEGIFVTHYHDDHTDAVQQAAETFNCPVYATPEYSDVLEHPDAYHLPAMTANPISVTVVKSGHQMKWREFDLTFYFFPGQTYYHGALFVKKPNETPVLFAGDAFAPSGMDDYCVLNRNLLGDDQGYLKCLQHLRDTPGEYWVVNEHIRHVFRFNKQELDYLEARYRKRIEIQRQLFPFDAPNYGVDEQWAWFYPYATKSSPGGKHTIEFRVTNHSGLKRDFIVTPRAHNGATVADGSTPVRLTIPSHESKTVRFQITAPQKAGVSLVTADVHVPERLGAVQAFPQMSEAMIIVEDE